VHAVWVGGAALRHYIVSFQFRHSFTVVGLLIVEPRTSRRRRFRRAARTADIVAICVPRHCTLRSSALRLRLCERRPECDTVCAVVCKRQVGHVHACRIPPQRAQGVPRGRRATAAARHGLLRPSVRSVALVLGLHAAASRESGLGAARANDMIARHDDERLPSVPPSNVPLAIPDAITACARRLEACNHGSCTQEQECRAAKQKAKRKPLAVGAAASSLSSQRHRAAHAPPRARDPRAAARRAESSGASTPSAPPSFFCSWARCR